MERSGKEGQKQIMLPHRRSDFVDEVLMEHYEEAKRIELVQDNLNIHTFGSFYEYLPIERAAKLRRMLNFHYTPKHGSWLNMVEPGSRCHRIFYSCKAMPQ